MTKYAGTGVGYKNAAPKLDSLSVPQVRAPRYSRYRS